MRIEEILGGPCASVQDVTRELSEEQPDAASQLADVLNNFLVRRYYEMTKAVEAVVKVIVSPLNSARLLVAVFSPLLPRLKPFSVALIVNTVALRFEDTQSARLLAEFFSSGIKSTESATAGPAEKQAALEAQQLLSVTVGALAVKAGDLPTAQQILLKDVTKQIAGAAGVAPPLNAQLHRAVARLYRAMTQESQSTTYVHEVYNALSLYLAYQRLEDLDPGEIIEVARDFAVSGLFSSRTFDFGELRDARVLTGLADADKWLLNLISAAAMSDVDQFREIMIENNSKAQELFGADGLKVLQEKLQVSLLLDLCFRRPSVTGQDIIKKCSVPDLEAAARLFMKAAGAGVLQGRIDGLTGEFFVDWVLPRAADKERMAEMAEGLQAWGQRIRALQVAQ